MRDNLYIGLTNVRLYFFKYIKKILQIIQGTFYLLQTSRTYTRVALFAFKSFFTDYKKKGDPFLDRLSMFITLLSIL